MSKIDGTKYNFAALSDDELGELAIGAAMSMRDPVLQKSLANLIVFAVGYRERTEPRGLWQSDPVVMRCDQCLTERVVTHPLQNIASQFHLECQVSASGMWRLVPGQSARTDIAASQDELEARR